MPPQSGARVLRFLEKGRLKTDKVRFSGAKPMNPTQTHSLPCANAGEGWGGGGGSQSRFSTRKRKRSRSGKAPTLALPCVRGRE
ncbi:hypothetical protein [Kingella potus]|uniref:hypothetical protein n=1 Tax=Kingella potus TaxID=265175 RepID=UPI0011C06733|nr:hypothetical protein [Kingella potus]